MSYQLTKKEILKEAIKCGKDPVYFVNNYIKISHPMRGLIPFKTYEFQDEALQNFNDYRFNILLKARQLGLSTITAAYVAWMMLFHRDKNILVMATKFSTASNLVKKVKGMIKNLPEWIRISEISIDNRTSFELSNGSQIKASSTSHDAGRSEALSLLVVDEAAHVDGLEELWTGLYPTLSTGGRCIVLSTPNGVGNWFHTAYYEAEQRKNDFYPTKLLWDVHPDRDQEWFEKETRNMSRRQIAQELECNFNMSGETVFHGDDIASLETKTCEPKYRSWMDRNYWIWKECDPKHNYMLVADVARGDGRDYSVFHIYNLNTMEIIAEYQGKITPDLFSQLLFQAGSEYGNCLVIVENNSVGFSVLSRLEELGYPNIYYSIKSTHEYIEPYQVDYNSNTIAGFTTSHKTRPLIVAKMEEFVRNKVITIYSSRLINEMKTFIWRNGKPQAMRGSNDDLVIACAIGCWVRDTALSGCQKDLEYNKAMLDSILMTNKILDTTIRGQIGHNTAFQKEREDQENFDKQKEFLWLLKG